MSSLFILLCLSAIVSATVVSYPRPSIYDVSATYALKVNGVFRDTVSYFGYDYVQISMSDGQPLEFRDRGNEETTITTYIISP